jgi:thioredoxin 1
MELNQILNPREFEYLIKSKDALMVYFFQEKCGVCKTLFPKVENLIRSRFPKIELLLLEAEKNRELTAQLRMLAVPGIILFLDGKEFFRSNGLVAIPELEGKIERPYQLLFE